LGTLRIVAGAWKGRRLRVPAGNRVRPTPDRVREALFSIVAGEIEGARVLDAYAGTGALGLEALSRGAANVVFVEADREVAGLLRQNVASLAGGGRARVVLGRVETLLRRGQLAVPFDVVFADPPYRSGGGPGFLAGLVEGRVLAPGALVVVERDERSPAAEAPAGGGLVRIRTARYGRTCLDFYRGPEAPR
jgi:16S rRNA (guanine966-N2)-methyltransferase